MTRSQPEREGETSRGWRQRGADEGERERERCKQRRERETSRGGRGGEGKMREGERDGWSE